MEQGLQCVQVSLKDVDSRQHSGVAKSKLKQGHINESMKISISAAVISTIW